MEVVVPKQFEDLYSSLMDFGTEVYTSQDGLYAIYNFKGVDFEIISHVDSNNFVIIDSILSI